MHGSVLNDRYMIGGNPEVKRVISYRKKEDNERAYFSFDTLTIQVPEYKG